jgi:PAS domain-containing protein
MNNHVQMHTAGEPSCRSSQHQEEAASSELTEGEAKLRQIASALREAVWLQDTRTLAVLYVNPAYETFWGQSCEDGSLRWVWGRTFPIKDESG